MYSKKILIVEDEPELRSVLALELETSGYEVFLAGDGQEGFAIAQEVKPDLIITDVVMPIMDGNQLFKKIRASDFGRAIPFFILTARGKMKEYFETMEVEAFIEKPFNAEDLLKKIERVLQHPTPGHFEKRKSQPGQDPTGNKKVLILEDDPWLVDRLKLIFSEYGYTIKIVQSSGECLEEAVRFNPDIIIAKYILEGMNANGLVGLLRDMSHLKNVPIFIYSNTVLGGEKESVLKAGATDFLVNVNGIKLLKKTNEFFNL